MNLKQFLKKWSEGIKNSTPEQQLRAKCIGLIGAIIGLLIILVVMAIRKTWYIMVLMFFLLWLQVVQYIGTRQQYKQTMEMMKEINTKETAKKEDEGTKEIDEITPSQSKSD